jgi:uncharacterized protein YkwD
MIRLNAILIGVVLGAATPAITGDFEQDVLAELNFARGHPEQYAQELSEFRQDFKGRLMRGDDATGDIMTREGVSALDEAIRFLAAQPALPPLDHGVKLAAAASDLVAEQGEHGTTGHVSAGGRNPSQRVQRRGGGPYVAETISYGSLTPASIVRQLIIDDGVADRGHRKVIFTATFRYAGVGCGPHTAYRFMCVIDYGATADGGPGLAPPSAALRAPSAALRAPSAALRAPSAAFRAPSAAPRASAGG